MKLKDQNKLSFQFFVYILLVSFLIAAIFLFANISQQYLVYTQKSQFHY
jgi:hypothetical protein